MAWADKKPKVEAPAAAPLTLQDRVGAFKQEIEAFIHDRALKLQRGTGLPLEVVKQTMTGGAHCVCNAALRVASDIEKERDLAARQSA